MSYQSPLLDFSRSDPNNGTLFDTRDGQSYPVVKIGNQIWLAENFRYLPSIEKGDKYCNSNVYENNNDYLDLHYGRLYDWNTANSIAPEGWNLPSKEDFQELINYIMLENRIPLTEISSNRSINLSFNLVKNYLNVVIGGYLYINTFLMFGDILFWADAGGDGGYGKYALEIDELELITKDPFVLHEKSCYLFPIRLIKDS